MTGKDITVILSQNGQALASTRIKSHEIEALCPTIEVASSTQQDWEEHIAGRKSWSLNVGYLILSDTQVANMLKVGQTFDITMKHENSTLLSGTALLTTEKDTFTVDNLCQGSFAFKGSGALVKPNNS